MMLELNYYNYISSTEYFKKAHEEFKYYLEKYTTDVNADINIKYSNICNMQLALKKMRDAITREIKLKFFSEKKDYEILDDDSHKNWEDMTRDEIESYIHSISKISEPKIKKRSKKSKRRKIVNK